MSCAISLGEAGGSGLVGRGIKIGLRTQDSGLSKIEMVNEKCQMIYGKWQERFSIYHLTFLILHFAESCVLPSQFQKIREQFFSF